MVDLARKILLLDKTRIIAPIDGVVTERHTHAGETVEVAARIVTIADLNRIRIEAEVDEFDTGRVTLGAGVLISAEGFPGALWKGKVEEIPDAVVARRNRPEDPGRPIDSRVLPVKITFSEPTPLKLRQRIEVQILAGEMDVTRLSFAIQRDAVSGPKASNGALTGAGSALSWTRKSCSPTK
jgi:HlyD family secretion protein